VSEDPFDRYCAICFSALEAATQLGDVRLISCPQCGSYEITRTAEHQARRCLDQEACPHDASEGCLGPAMAGLRGRKRANASAWLRANPGARLTTKDLVALSAIRAPSVIERARQLLMALAGASGFLGDQVFVEYKMWVAATWSLNEEEVGKLLEYLASQGWIERSEVLGPQDHVTLTMPGWMHVESVTRSNVESEQGFVAMWFRPTLQRLYTEAISPAVREAGYRPHRVDSREFAGRIDDEIIGQIRRSRFLVADFTGHRGGVYWEAGFAFGLGLPVFFTCCRRDLRHLHFDVRQYNTIDWTSRADLRRRLRARIVATLGQGPRVSEEVD
jgi:hypothetical protein